MYSTFQEAHLSVPIHVPPLAYGVIRSDCTERGFQNVDRKFFVPRVRLLIAISHVRAPH